MQLGCPRIVPPDSNFTAKVHKASGQAGFTIGKDEFCSFGL